jgi:hypothetical protein
VITADANMQPGTAAGRWDVCFTRRADVLFELADAVLCADGPVRVLAGLSLAPEHRRGHGALYDAVSAGRIDIARPGGRWPACRCCGPPMAG